MLAWKLRLSLAIKKHMSLYDFFKPHPYGDGGFGGGSSAMTIQLVLGWAELVNKLK